MAQNGTVSKDTAEGQPWLENVCHCPWTLLSVGCDMGQEGRETETVKWKLIGLKEGKMSKCQQKSLLLTFIWDTDDNARWVGGKDEAN